MDSSKLAMILIGDHLGQVKKIIPTSKDVITLTDCAQPTKDNPVVSINPLPNKQTHQLIANQCGDLYLYDAIVNETRHLELGLEGSLLAALPMKDSRGVMAIYDSHIQQHHVKSKKNSQFIRFKQKNIKIMAAKFDDSGHKLAAVGRNLTLNVYDVETKKQLFKGDMPERDWLGIQPDCFVSNLDFVGGHRVATCSRSDSVIRIFDINREAKTKPIISINIDQTAFNEHADSARFHTIASTGLDGHSIVVGSNVGQLLAIDLRFNVKEQPRKKLKPSTHKMIGGFKGFRGASIKDVKIVPASEINDEGDNIVKHKVLSCCLDRYFRLHNYSRKSRELDQHYYMTTKPLCCSPIFYE